MRYLDVVLALVLLVVGQYMSPTAIDVEKHFHPAVFAVLHGDSPYSIPGFYNPAWSLAFLLPIGWMSVSVASVFIRALNLAGFVLVSRHLGCTLAGRLGLLLSPPVLVSVLGGGFDGTALLGLLLPSWLGLIVLALKPQLTMGAMVLFIKRRCRIWPLLLLFLLTSLLFGLPLIPLGFLRSAAWNIPLWPWGLLFGIPMLGIALRQDQDDLALASSPFFSPYTALTSFSVVMLLFAKRRPHMLLWIDGLVLVLGVWIYA